MRTVQLGRFRWWLLPESPLFTLRLSGFAEVCGAAASDVYAAAYAALGSLAVVVRRAPVEFGWTIGLGYREWRDISDRSNDYHAVVWGVCGSECGEAAGDPHRLCD